MRDGSCVGPAQPRLPALAASSVLAASNGTPRCCSRSLQSPRQLRLRRRRLRSSPKSGRSPWYRSGASGTRLGRRCPTRRFRVRKAAHTERDRRPAPLAQRTPESAHTLARWCKCLPYSLPSTRTQLARNGGHSGRSQVWSRPGTHLAAASRRPHERNVAPRPRSGAPPAQSRSLCASTDHETQLHGRSSSGILRPPILPGFESPVPPQSEMHPVVSSHSKLTIPE